jgi:hypothetical protein
MNRKHIIGYILLAFGVLIIAYALFSSYGVFTGSAQAPQLFNAPPTVPSGLGGSQQEQAEKLLQDQFAKLLPQESITDTLNLFAWSAFAGLLIFGGTQLSSLGIKLLKV